MNSYQMKQNPVRCVEMWNNLPRATQAVEDLDEFKKLLDWHYSIAGSY